ncbi:MAG: GH92 family glycosyl hydrolase [Muribaculaceae bacterium]|nr:GH92 family glycosyl hydrolase [Muribaculaceae bacterium]
MNHISRLALGLIPLASLVSACGNSSGTNETSADTTAYHLLVNPFIGTDFTGNTYPGAQVPFGMVQLSPDNGLPGWDRISGYYYPDSTIAGFSHTHLSGTGAGDLYDISFMPVMIPWKEAEAPLGIHSKFSHDEEEASAGYYKVRLSDYDITVELTASERTGVQRYTFPEGEACVIVNLAKAMNWDATVDTQIDTVGSNILAGYRFSNGWARNQKLYFVSVFSKDWQKVELDSTLIDAETSTYGYIAKVFFNTTAGETITVATALSAVDVDGAKVNLFAEHPDGVDNTTFNRTLKNAQSAWDKELGAIAVEPNPADSTDDERIKFYTALYHSMLAPTLYSDADGQYRGPDNKIHTTDNKWNNYSTFSLWDTYRAAHPLYTVIDPDITADFIQSLLAFYDQNGRLPVWNFQGSETDMMIGYHAAAVIADAYLKGIEGFDAEKALEACVATANNDTYRGIGLYKQNGYIPYDVADPYNAADDWSMSRTLEYAYDDYAIARMAQKMGRDSIADVFFARSQNYRNLFDPASRFFRPKATDGSWWPDYNPVNYISPICESNGWHYFWAPVHDLDGLATLVGGKDALAERLDSMMTFTPDDTELPIFSTGMVGQYAQGNEPSHHVLYLYNYLRQPWKGAKYINQVMTELYTNTPEGLSGNEDCGQMSAWYVWSALGFYPADAVSGNYELGTPRFRKAVVKVPGNDGKTFTVSAPNLSSENIYIKKATLNGKPLKRSYITHSDIMHGGVLELEMTSETGNIWY